MVAQRKYAEKPFFAKIKELLIDKDGISTGDGTGIALYILVIGLCVYGAFFYYGG